MAKKKTHTAQELAAMLRARYCAPEYAFVEEARAGTGWKANRSADGLALSLWPSRGIYFSGFEIKVSRSDWRREVSNPAKAEEIASFCKYWWVVAPAGLVDSGDLPETWGLLEPERGKLKVKVKAPALDPAPVTIHVIAALLRRVTEQYTPTGGVRDAIQAQVSERLTRATEAHEYEMKCLRDRIGAFEKSSGVSIDEWSAGEIGEAVRYVRSHGVASVAADLEGMAVRAERIAERARTEADAVRASVKDIAS